MTDPAPTTAARFRWGGFHHVALVTPDLDATIRFYRDVLGLVVAVSLPATELHGRHALLAVDAEARSFLHFFEQPGATIHPYPFSTVAGLHLVAFSVLMLARVMKLLATASA